MESGGVRFVRKRDFQLRVGLNPDNPVKAAELVEAIHVVKPSFMSARLILQVYQPLVRTPFVRLWNNFRVKLGLIGRIRGSQLIFRGGRRNAETITYAIVPHGGGIALLNMRVRLYHLSEDRSGTDMCLRTFVIMNGPSAP